MKFSAGLIAGVAAVGFKVASGAPLAARTAAINDGDILNYALTLEHLEDAFYTQGLQLFTLDDFLAANFTEDFFSSIVTISNDEATHVDFLEKALTAAGFTPVKPCTYDFEFGDVFDFILASGGLEGVGVGAYIGAAASIQQKPFLTAAASILAIEARHSAFIRAVSGNAPFPQPFDTPLSPPEVLSLAGQLVIECPSDNPRLPFVPLPVLKFKLTEGQLEIKSGSTIQLSTEAVNPNSYGPIYAAFLTLTGPIFAEVRWTHYGNLETTVPEGINGQSYVVLTSSNTEITDDNEIAGPVVIEVSNTVFSG